MKDSQATGTSTNKFDFALGFKIDGDTAESKKLNVTLKTSTNTSAIKWEGLLGEDPYAIKDANIITGICLWDSRWKVEFYNERFPSKKGTTKIIAMESTRNQALSLMQENRKIKYFFVPKTLGDYHTMYIVWLKEKISQLKPKHVFVQIPLDEYHMYIGQLEDACRRTFPEMHAQLDIFSTLICEEIEKLMKDTETEFSFVQPMRDQGITNPVESFLWAYQNLPVIHEGEKFIGIEDLNEVRLILSNPSVTDGILGVFDLPDPYLNSTTTDQNSVTLSID